VRLVEMSMPVTSASPEFSLAMSLPRSKSSPALLPLDSGAIDPAGPARQHLRFSLGLDLNVDFDAMFKNSYLEFCRFK
jgi:hypothetical protein